MTGFEGTAVSQGEEGLISVFACAQWVCARSRCVGERTCAWLVIFGDMWETLTISVCTLWLGLFWTQGGWWSPQPSHPAGRDRWRVVVHHQHTEQNVMHTNFIWDSKTLVKHMKTTYVVYTGWDKVLFPLNIKKTSYDYHSQNMEIKSSAKTNSSTVNFISMRSLVSKYFTYTLTGQFIRYTTTWQQLCSCRHVGMVKTACWSSFKWLI